MIERDAGKRDRAAADRQESHMRAEIKAAQARGDYAKAERLASFYE